jgi:hypothetical protein
VGGASEPIPKPWAGRPPRAIASSIMEA